MALRVPNGRLHGMKRTLAAMLALLALTGCTPTKLDTRATCDAVAPIMREFGKVAPTPSRYAEYTPKVKAVVDRADDAARKVFAPMVTTMEAGAKGGNIFALAGVNLGIQSVCKGAGSTAWS